MAWFCQCGETRPANAAAPVEEEDDRFDSVSLTEEMAPLLRNTALNRLMGLHVQTPFLDNFTKALYVVATGEWTGGEKRRWEDISQRVAKEIANDQSRYSALSRHLT